MKHLLPLCMLTILLVNISACKGQPSSPFAPESGVYTGNTLNTSGTMNYSYNAITGFGFQPGISTTPGINLMGDMTISNSGGNKGSYSFSKLKEWKGNWEYNPENDKLSFTGPLKDALQYYHAGKGQYNFRFLVKAKQTDTDGVVYYFSRKASKAFPKPTKPNRQLTGSFTVKPDLNTIGFFDAATGKIQKSFNGRTAVTNDQHQTIAVGFTDNTSYYQVSITDENGKTINYDPATIMGYNWNFSNYQYGILNSQGTAFALLGKTPDSYANLTYTPGEYAIGIFDRSGRKLGLMPVEFNRYVIPSFLPDGRLVHCPKTGGIAVTSSNYSSSKTIYSNVVNAFAVSPDGSSIVFSEGVHFYTIKIDGTGKTQIVCAGEKLEADKVDNVITMAWAPDGKNIAVNYKLTGGYGILIVPLDGGAYWFLRDDDGEMYLHNGPVLSWH